MKKMIAAILAVAMVLGVHSTSYAGQNLGQNESQSIDVTAKYSDDITTPDVYSVEIVWDNMTFSYSEAGTMDWNPETHTYTENVTAGWDKTSADVTVTNHSNVDVDVTFGYVPVESYGVTTGLTNTDAAVNLTAGVVGEADEAASVTATLSVSGTPSETVTEEGVVIGTITITIS